MTDELARIVVTDVVEHEDGSATYTFDMDDASAKKMAELGIELILTCAAYGLDVQDALEDIRWIGEQREHRKKLMEDCDKEFSNESLALSTDETHRT